jgi:DNA-binding response OmpR family regulator
MMSSTKPANGVDLPSRPVRVLFADDDPDTLELLGSAAEHIGHFDYRLACDGGEVETWLNSEEFDVLCFDVEMPVAYGTTIAAEVRRMDWGIPIIFLTGRTGREVRSTAHQTQAQLITKPVEVGYLMELIARLARERAPYHGPERREMSVNTTEYRRRRSDTKLQLPESLRRVAAGRSAA